MKMRLLNLPFVSSSIETIEFNTFCSGGSPEYVEAKKHLDKLREMDFAKFGKSKIGSTSPFKVGESNLGLTYNNAIIGDIENFEVVETTPITLGWSTVAKSRSLKAYSLYINPLALFDVRFALIGAIVILVAILEKGIAQAGMVNLAAMLSGILRIAFPVVAIGSMIYLISQVGSFL